MNIIRTSFLLALCEMGDKIGRSQADRQLFELTANDLRRHLSVRHRAPAAIIC